MDGWSVGMVEKPEERVKDVQGAEPDLRRGLYRCSGCRQEERLRVCFLPEAGLESAPCEHRRRCLTIPSASCQAKLDGSNRVGSQPP